VQLSGTIVKRASLYNDDAIQALDLHIGDICYVEKGGEIIPKIVGVDKDARRGQGAKVSFVTVCPECGTPLERIEGEATWFCPNQYGCPPQIKGRIEHFVARRAMNIEGIGPETIDALYANGLVSSIADLYSLTREQIMACPRDKGDDLEPDTVEADDALLGGLFAAAATSRRKPAQRRFTALLADKILDALSRSAEVPFERVLFAVGIRFVGETVAKRLASAFRTMEALAAATYDELIAVEDIGDKIALSVIDYFANPDNRRIIERLREAGLQMALAEPAEGETGDALKGKAIVISGVFEHHSRDEYKALIERHGGKNTGSISAKTSFVLAGSNVGPAKLEKATKLGIPIVGEDEFLAMLQQQS
jgi:DNA ligase (NAD+)